MTNTATPTITRKTDHEIEILKRQWQADPCWDIEDTEGFEAHRQELAAWRAQFEAEQDRRFQLTLRLKAVEYNIPGNTKLASHILHLEQRVRDFERRISALEGRQ